jgi:hypothetical protein
MHNSPSTIANAMCMLFALLLFVCLVVLGATLILQKMYMEALTTFLISTSVYLAYIGFRNSVIEAAEEDNE